MLYCRPVDNREAVSHATPCFLPLLSTAPGLPILFFRSSDQDGARWNRRFYPRRPRFFGRQWVVTGQHQRTQTGDYKRRVLSNSSSSQRVCGLSEGIGRVDTLSVDWLLDFVVSIHWTAIQTGVQTISQLAEQQQQQQWEAIACGFFRDVGARVASTSRAGRVVLCVSTRTFLGASARKENSSQNSKGMLVFVWRPLLLHAVRSHGELIYGIIFIDVKCNNFQHTTSILFLRRVSRGASQNAEPACQLGQDQNINQG